MDAKDLVLIQNHVDDDEELKNLWDKHVQFGQKLEKIDRKPYLTEEEKIDKKRVQLAKLAGKTRIEEILAKYRITASG